jgi:hypothetical protein
MNVWELLKWIEEFFEDLWDTIMDWYDDIIN